MNFSLKIIVSTFIVYFVFFNGIDIITGESEEEREEICKQCTNKIVDSLQNMKELLENRDNMEINTPEPCAPCMFSGIISISLNNKVCPEKIMEGKDICYDHLLNLKYKNIRVNCTCSLPYNPKDVIALMQEKSKEPFQGMSCGKTGEIPVDPKVLGEQFMGQMDMDPFAMAKMAECRPRPPPIGSLKPPPEKVSGGIFGSYDEFQFAVTLRVCAVNTKVRTIKVIQDTSVGKKFNVTCIATFQKEFLEPCYCFAKTGYLQKIVKSAIPCLIPCLGGEKIQADTDFIEQIVCTDLLDFD